MKYDRDRENMEGNLIVQPMKIDIGTPISWVIAPTFPARLPAYGKTDKDLVLLSSRSCVSRSCIKASDTGFDVEVGLWGVRACALTVGTPGIFDSHASCHVLRLLKRVGRTIILPCIFMPSGAWGIWGCLDIVTGGVRRSSILGFPCWKVVSRFIHRSFPRFIDNHPYLLQSLN